MKVYTVLKLFRLSAQMKYAGIIVLVRLKLQGLCNYCRPLTGSHRTGSK